MESPRGLTVISGLVDQVMCRREPVAAAKDALKGHRPHWPYSQFATRAILLYADARFLSQLTTE
jgi:hypothetical protein